MHGGQRWIPELGFCDDRNRFMSPELGRFLQSDPIGFGGDSNLYRYCSNDWVNRIDPMGLLQGSMGQQEEKVASQAKVEVTGSHLGADAGDLDNLLAARYAAGLSTTYARAFQSAHSVTVTGQVIGGAADPRMLKNATPGELNDREAPTGLELQPKKTEDYEYYKMHHLQLKHGNGGLWGKGWAEEHVEKVSGNLKLGPPSGPRFFDRGDVADRVGPKERPSSRVSGDLVTRQWYRIYYGFPGELHYYDFGSRENPAFRQHTHIEHGQVTAADVAPW